MYYLIGVSHIIYLIRSISPEKGRMSSVIRERMSSVEYRIFFIYFLTNKGMLKSSVNI